MYVMLVLFCVLMTVNTALTKVFQKGLSSGLFPLIVYNIINAMIACVFFAVSSGFSIKLNVATVIYSVVYALIICINLSAQVFAFSKAPVSVVTLVSMAGSVLLPSLFGIVWFKESLTLRLVISSIFIITAAFLPFAGRREEKQRFSVYTLLICALLFALNGASVILMKLYAIDEISKIVCDSTSMFFLTNVAIIFVCVIALFVFAAKNPHFFSEERVIKKVIFAFSPKQLILILSKTITANLSGIVQVGVLAKMATSTFSVLSSAMLLVGAGVVSAFCFREKQTFGTMLALIFAIIAIAVNP